MNEPPRGDPSHLEELLAGEALGDLSHEESRELSQLLASSNGQSNANRREIERTAALVDLALAGGIWEAMPEKLRSSIARDAGNYVAQRSEATAGDAPSASPAASRGGAPRGLTVREAMAWLAAAACLLAALGAFWMRVRSAGPETVRSATQLRADLLSRAPDVVQVGWAAADKPFDAAVSGDVVWSNSRQEGYLRFRGMAVNDPSKRQYQLWIVDPARDAEPIDGGVFDIPSTGEVVLPIDAKLPVVSPQAFAVTVEKPGGVVVSEGPLRLVASLP